MRLIPVMLGMTLVGLGGAPLAGAITWDEARQAAASGNPDYASARLGVEKAGYEVSSASAGFLPRVTLSASRAMSSEKQENPRLPDETFTNSASVSASQGLFSGGRDLARRAAARASEDAARAARDRASVDARAELRKAFDRVVLLDEMTRLNRVVAERRATNVRIATLRYEGGREHKGSVLKTEASAMAARAEVGQSEASLALARQRLGRLMGRSIGDGERVVGELPRTDVPGAQSTTARGKSPEVSEAQARARAAEANVRVARSAFLGDVSIEASAGRSGVDLMNDETRTTVSINASIPLFNASNLPAVRSAAVERAKAEIAERDVVERRRLAEIEAANALANARETALSADKMLEASRVLADVSRQRYTLGLISFADWDMAESDLINAERSALNARAEIATAIANSDSLSGVTLEER